MNRRPRCLGVFKFVKLCVLRIDFLAPPAVSTMVAEGELPFVLARLLITSAPCPQGHLSACQNVLGRLNIPDDDATLAAHLALSLGEEQGGGDRGPGNRER